MNETVRKEAIKFEAGLQNSGNHPAGNEDRVDVWTRELSAQIIGQATKVLKEFGLKDGRLAKEDLIIISKGMVFCLLMVLEKDLFNAASGEVPFTIERIKKELSDSLYKVLFQKDATEDGYEYFKVLFDEEYMEFKRVFDQSSKNITLDNILKELLNNEFEMVFPRDQLKEIEGKLASFFEKNIMPQLSNLSSL